MCTQNAKNKMIKKIALECKTKSNIKRLIKNLNKKNSSPTVFPFIAYGDWTVEQYQLL